MHIQTYTCTHAPEQTHTHTHMHTHTHTYTHTHNINTLTHTHEQKYAHTLIHTQTHSFAHTGALVRTRTYTHAHKHIHTNIYTHGVNVLSPQRLPFCYDLQAASSSSARPARTRAGRLWSVSCTRLSRILEQWMRCPRLPYSVCCNKSTR